MKKTIHIRLAVLGLVLLSATLINKTASFGRIKGLSVSPKNKAIKGLVIPHHQLAGEFITKSIEVLHQNANDYEIIVVLGPNHFHPESYTLTSSATLKNVATDSEFIKNTTITFPKTLVDQDIVEAEHGVMVAVNHLRQYFPGAKFVPFVISPYYTEESLREIANFLSQNLPTNTLYVASVDFSHNLLADESLLNNIESIKTIQSFDFTKLFEFKDTYMDSPASIALVMMVMQNLKKTNWMTINSLHSGLLLSDPTIQGTSYVTGIFY